MNKYELALVVNAKLEEEERAAVVEKAKGYVTRYGGTVGEVEEWGKNALHTKFSICVKHITPLFRLKQTQQLRQRARAICVLWTTY